MSASIKILYRVFLEQREVVLKRRKTNAIVMRYTLKAYCKFKYKLKKRGVSTDQRTQRYLTTIINF